MDFRSISSVQSYVKTLDSKYQAEKQQEAGPAVSTDSAKQQSKLDEWIKQRQVREIRDRDDEAHGGEHRSQVGGYPEQGVQRHIVEPDRSGSISRQRIRCCTRALRQLIWRKRSTSAS